MKWRSVGREDEGRRGGLGGGREALRVLGWSKGGAVFKLRLVTDEEANLT